MTNTKYMTTKTHKVFISFQHGCDDKINLCGSKTENTWNGVQKIFHNCEGYCGRNGNGFYSFDTLKPQCKYYKICGHYWKEKFEFLMTKSTEKMISKVVSDGDINTNIATETIRQKIRDEFIADATITVVLIGPETWKRKHVDWEISSSIRDTKNNSRCGLIGILLPTYPDYDKIKNTYNPKTIPPRLQKNIDCGFATIHVWNENPSIVQEWIHNAFERRAKINPDNSYPMFSNNRSIEQTQWQ